MADSSMAIDTGEIVDFSTKDANDPDELDNTISEIVTKFNAMLDTSTGHNHDSINSPALASGITGWSYESLTLALLAGAFGVRGGL